MLRLLPVLVLLSFGGQQSPAAPKLPLDQIKLPPGFTIELYTADVPNARQMAMGDEGTLFVGSRTARRVYAVVDRNGDKKGDQVYTIASGLQSPSGIAFRDGALYVAEVSRILRYDGIESKLDSPPEPVVVNGTLPTETHHGWKYLGFGPDGMLYVPVGAPCNVCDRTGEDERFGTITRMKPDGTGQEIFARGIRNTVGFDWHPQTRELWMTENGRDNMGDNVPPDELLRAPKPGLHFGFPSCHAGDVPDPEFGKRPCSEFEPPALKLGAHVAAIGMKFYTGQMFPQNYRNQIFIAEHGSWNRSTPQGYRIMLVKLDGNKAVSYEPFAEGWLRGARETRGSRTLGDSWGRPSDVYVMPDGSLLIADDQAGVVYRVTYTG